MKKRAETPPDEYSFIRYLIIYSLVLLSFIQVRGVMVHMTHLFLNLGILNRSENIAGEYKSVLLQDLAKQLETRCNC